MMLEEWNNLYKHLDHQLTPIRVGTHPAKSIRHLWCEKYQESIRFYTAFGISRFMSLGFADVGTRK